MREILFRGKFDNGGGQICWTEGDLIHYSKEEVYILDQNFRLWDIPHDGCKVDVNTLGQFTGLTDKNGVRIFEGDIIVMDEYPYYDNGVLNYVGEVVWFENTFSFGLILNCVNKNKVGISNGVSENIEDDMVFEVIGNIHDNPDLI